VPDDVITTPESSDRAPIANELAAEGFDDLGIVGKGGVGVIFRCREPCLFDRLV
jgi:hypothetical protein